MLKRITNPAGTHLNEATFRRYEDTIILFTKTHPSALVVTPKNFECSTFSTQLRSAINAHIIHRFQSNVDPDNLSAIWKSSIVTVDGKNVIIGPKHSVREAIRAEHEIGEAHTPSYLVELEAPTLTQLNALAYLYSTNVFTTPSRILTIPDGFVPMVGMDLSQQPDNSWLLL